MSMIVGMLALAVLMLSSGTYSAYCAATGLRCGRFRSPFWNLERARNPIGYWLVFICYSVIALMLVLPIVDFLR